MLSIVIAALIGLYFIRYRGHPLEVFSPKAAWLRACIYFCVCYLVAILLGVFNALISNPIAAPEQLLDSVWHLWVGGLFLLVTVAYWVIWARYTLRFERRLDLLPQVIFGLLWGLASGMLFLSFYHLAQRIGTAWPTWAVWLLAYTTIGVWQWLWQDYYWDVYISPEHDTPLSIRLKVFATHIPNITACLIFFTIYRNYAIFVLLQTWALLGASIAMRMPTPWSREVTPPATQGAGLLGFKRASGYVSDDPANDPYLQAAHLPG